MRLTSPTLLARASVALLLVWSCTALALSQPEPAPSTPAPSTPAPAASASSDMDMLMQPVVVVDGSDSAPLPLPPPTEQGTSPEGGEAWSGKAKERDLLTMGGIYFQRAELSSTRKPEGLAMRPTLPALLDVYLDAAPSESVRAFSRGRLLYDPVDPVLSTPNILLDQLWIQFGIANRVFVTAGRQQLKWGSSKVWNPTDFLRQPNPLPLDQFDLRTGVDMLKVNIPWEALASNLWLMATADLKGPESQPLRYGAAARAEVALGTSELAASAVFLQGRRPRYGLDWSMGVSIFDLNAEVALVRDAEVRLWERSGTGFARRELQGPKVQASAGGTATIRLADTYRLQVRLEGLYNELGSEDRGLLTWVRAQGDYQALYFGRAYAMAQFILNRRSIFEPSMALTTLANLQDASLLTRLDVGVLPLREVYINGFVEVPYGTPGGEFYFEPDPTVAELPSTGLPLLRAGLSIRVRM